MLRVPPTTHLGPVPALEELLGWVERSSAVQAGRRAKQVARLEADLALQARSPDVTLSAYRSSLGGPDARQGVQASLSLPLVDWGTLRAEQIRREAEVQARRCELEGRRRETRLQIETAYAWYQSAREREHRTRELAGKFERLATNALRGYEAGLLTLTEILEAQRSFHEALLDVVGAAAEVPRREVALHILAGGSVPWEEAP